MTEIPIPEKALIGYVKGKLSAEGLAALLLIQAGKGNLVKDDAAYQEAVTFSSTYLVLPPISPEGEKAVEGITTLNEQANQRKIFFRGVKEEMTRVLKYSYPAPSREQRDDMWQFSEGDLGVMKMIIQNMRNTEEASGAALKYPYGYILKVLKGSPIESLRLQANKSKSGATAPIISEAMQRVIDKLPEMPPQDEAKRQKRDAVLEGLKEGGFFSE